MRFLNLFWAISDVGRSHYQVASAAGLSESRFSRGLHGRLQFTKEEQQRIAAAVGGYSVEWLFSEVDPPERKQSAVETADEVF